MDEEQDLPDHLVAPVLGAVRMTAPDAQVQEWSLKPDMPAEQIKATAEHFLRTNAVAQRSYDETKANWDRHFPGVDAPSEDQYAYWQKRAPTETMLDITRAQARQEMPGGVVVPGARLETSRLSQSFPPIQWALDWRYKQAMRRYDAGDPDGEDLGIIARVERQHELRAQDEQGFVGKLRGLSLGAPFAIGEMMMAGKMAGPAAAAMTPAALAGTTGPLAATARFGIGAAATGATFPSMGPKAVADILADPRQAPKEAVEAIGKALVMHTVGQLQGAASQLGGPAAQLATSAVAFPAGSAAMEAVNHALGLETGWGTIGDLVSKDRRGEGIAAVLVGALEGVAVAGLHGDPEAGKGLAKGIADRLQNLRKQGYSPKAAAEKIAPEVQGAVPEGTRPAEPTPAAADISAPPNATTPAPGSPVAAPVEKGTAEAPPDNLDALEVSARKAGYNPATARKKVGALGTVEAVDAFYDEDKPLDHFARAFARERFGAGSQGASAVPTTVRQAPEIPTETAEPLTHTQTKARAELLSRPLQGPDAAARRQKALEDAQERLKAADIGPGFAAYDNLPRAVEELEQDAAYWLVQHPPDKTLELLGKKYDGYGLSEYARQVVGKLAAPEAPKAPQSPREQADALEAQVKAKRQKLTDAKVKPAEISRRLRADEKALDEARQAAAKSELKPITEADSAELLNRLDQPGHGLDKGEEYILRRRLDKTNQGSHKLISLEKPELGSYTEVLNKEKEAFRKLGYEGTAARLHAHELATSAMADVQSGKTLPEDQLHYADPENVYHNQAVASLDEIDAKIDKLYRDKARGKISDAQFKSKFAGLKRLADAGQEAAIAGRGKPGSREQVAAEAGDESPDHPGLGAAVGAEFQPVHARGVGAAPIPDGSQTPSATTGGWFQRFRDGLKAFGGQAYPALTRLSRASGERLAEAANAREAAKANLEYFKQQLTINGKKIADLTPEERRAYGAAMIERFRFQNTRDKIRENKARGMKTPMKADEVPTLIGQKGSPLDSVETFDRLEREILGFKDQYATEWTPEVEKNYRGIMGLDPEDEINSFTQTKDYPLNLIAVSADETDPQKGFVGVGRPKGMGGQRINRPGFTRKAKFTADAYDVDLLHMMERTLSVGTRAARRAEFARQAVEDGVIRKTTRGDKLGPEQTKEYTELGLRPSDMSGLDRNAGYYVKNDAYRDVVQGLGIGERSGQHFDWLRAATGVATRVSLLSPVELATHTANHFTALFRSGMGVPLVNLKDSFANAWSLWRKDPAFLKKAAELADIGAKFSHEARPGILGEKYAKFDPTNYLNKFTSKFIDTMQTAVRVQLGDAFDRMAQKGLFPKTETAKRNFINQALGNYSSEANGRFTQFFKDTGLQPFATAAHTFTTQGVKSVLGGAINTSATSVSAAFQARAIAMTKMMPFLAMGPVINAIAWGQAFPQNVPAFAIKTREDEDKKTHYFDPLAFTGLRRGARATGINAIVEGQLQGKTAGQTADQVIRDFWRSAEHLMAGPAVQAVHTFLTGENTVGRQVAAKVSTATTPAGIAAAKQRGAPAPGSSQYWENFKAAMLQANPIVGSFTQADRPKHPRTFAENLMQSAGPFGEKAREAPSQKRGR